MNTAVVEKSLTLDVVAVTPDDPVFADVLDLRYQVLDAPVDEPRRMEPLPKDLLLSTQHYVGMHGEQIVATLRVEHERGVRYVLSRVAIATEFQGLGLGGQLVGHAERRTRDMAGKVMSLLAQPQAASFYASLGYEHTGLVVPTRHYNYQQMHKHPLG